MPVVKYIRENGIAVGECSAGHIYFGTPRQIGYDEVVVSCELSEDGGHLTKTLKYGDLVLGNERLTKDAYIAQAVAKYASSPDAAEMAQADWDGECSRSSNGKAYVKSLVDGAVVDAEIFLTVYDWERMV